MGSLSFLAPWFLAGAVAVGVPIVLHMLRREAAPPLAFSAVRFLRQAPREQQRRRHLRDIWLLLLRMLALIVLALSFARPYIKTGQAVAAGTTIVAIDTSMSMSIPAQFARAQKAAISLISAAPAGQRLAVMAFDDRASLVSPPSFDRGSARAAVNGLTPGTGATNYAALLGSAARVMGSAGGKLAIVSDSQQTGWTGEGALPQGVELQIVDVSGPSENVAIAAVGRDGDTVAATLTNYGMRTRTVRATLAIDGKPAAPPQPVTLDAGRSNTVRFAGVVAATATGSAHVHIDDGSGLAADNDRYLVLDALPSPTVLVLSQQEDEEDAFYVREAVEAVEGARAFKMDTIPASQRNALQPDVFKAHQVIWLLGTHGLDRRVREQLTTYVREGGALFVTASPALDAATFASLFDEDARVHVEPPENVAFPTTLAPVDTRHPIFAAFGSFAANLGHAQFTQALRIVPAESSKVVARFTNGLPAMVEQGIGNGRVLTFASDVANEWNDFPRQPTFVPFVNESLRYLANQRARQQEMFVGGVTAVASAAAKPGVIKFGKPERLVAVNVDPQESRQAHISDAEFLSHIRRTDGESRNLDVVAHEQESAQSWWRYGLMALAAVLVLEGLLARRPAPASVDAAEGAKRTLSSAA